MHNNLYFFFVNISKIDTNSVTPHESMKHL